MGLVHLKPMEEQTANIGLAHRAQSVVPIAPSFLEHSYTRRLPEATLCTQSSSEGQSTLGTKAKT